MSFVTKGLVLAATIVATSVQAAEEIDIDKLVSDIRTKADKYGKLRPLLSDPDISVRLAAFDAMIKLENRSLRALALETAFASEESTLRARALEEVIFSRGNIVIKFEVGKIKESAKKYLAENNFNIISYGFSKKYRKKNCINLINEYRNDQKDCYNNNSITISGENISLRRGYDYWNGKPRQISSGSFRLSDDGDLVGHWSTNGSPGKIAARIEIY